MNDCSDLLLKLIGRHLVEIGPLAVDIIYFLSLFLPFLVGQLEVEFLVHSQQLFLFNQLIFILIDPYNQLIDLFLAEILVSVLF